MLAPEPTWWGEFIQRLRSEPLDALAVDFGVGVDALRAMLIEAGRGMAANEAPWWPELLRLRDTLSIRALARLFDTEPRRIRRGLARASLRVGGRELAPGEGVSRLAAYVDMLGKERDRAIARAAGVIPEAVQGERARLQIAAYRQRARVRLSRDDEEWIRGPRKLRRERFRPEPETLQVVRRPSRLGDGAPEREAPVVSRPSLNRPERPVPEALPRRAPSVSPGDFYAESRRRDSGWGEREHELDRLLQPSRVPRDGRMRIVRSEPARPVAEEPAPLGVIRRREVRTDAPPVGSVGDRPTRVEAERPSMVRPAAERPAPERVVRRVVAPAAEPVVAARPAERAAPVVERAAPTVERAAASATPERVTRRVTPPPAEPAVAARPARRVGAPAAAVAVAAAPAPEPVRVVQEIEWLVYVPGRDTPLRVSAPDIASAAGKAAMLLPANLLARASIWRADAEAPAPEFL